MSEGDNQRKGKDEKRDPLDGKSKVKAHEPTLLRERHHRSIVQKSSYWGTWDNKTDKDEETEEKTIKGNSSRIRNSERERERERPIYREQGNR